MQNNGRNFFRRYDRSHLICRYHVRKSSMDFPPKFRVYLTLRNTTPSVGALHPLPHCRRLISFVPTPNELRSIGLCCDERLIGGSMEQSAIQMTSRLSSLAAELGQIEDSVLLCQVWRKSGAAQCNELEVHAQSIIGATNESIRTYASLCVMMGVRPEAMDLIGDCHKKGATRIIENLMEADCSQHPRNLLPGQNIPACSALFLPMFDLADPLLRTNAEAAHAPTAVLEILVCESAKIRHNNSDLINVACEILDKYQFGINCDSTAFKEWSRYLPSKVSGMTSLSPSSFGSARNTLSRTSSMYLLTTDDSDDTMFGFDAFQQPGIGAGLQYPVPLPRTLLR